MNVTLGKSLGGGAPRRLRRLWCRRPSWSSSRARVGKTTERRCGYPISMAAISAYLRVVTDEDILFRVRQLEAVFAQRLLEIARRHPSVKRVAGQGLHWTIEPYRAGLAFVECRHRGGTCCLARGVARLAGGGRAVIPEPAAKQTSLFLAPPLVISDDQSRQLLDALDHGLHVADEEHERYLASNGSPERGRSEANHERHVSALANRRTPHLPMPDGTLARCAERARQNHRPDHAARQPLWRFAGLCRAVMVCQT